MTFVVMLGLAVTKDEKIPIFHKVFEGNIHDAKTIRHFFDDFDTEIRAWIVWDRGVTSRENIADALKAKFHVLCGVPLKGNVTQLVDETLQTDNIAQYENRVALTKTTLYARQLKYTYENIPSFRTTRRKRNFPCIFFKPAADNFSNLSNGPKASDFGYWRGSAMLCPDRRDA